MKQLFLTIPIIFAVSGCQVFGPTPPETTGNNEIVEVSMADGIWDGSLLLCGETISFDHAATEPLPEFRASERMGFCARTIKYLALHREYGDKTNYFGIAAEATGSYAIMNARFMRRVYSRNTWKFVEQLNLSLDSHVNAAAAELAAGDEGGKKFTNRMIAQENADVQQTLDALQANDPEVYATTLSELSGTFNPTNPMLVNAIQSNAFFSSYEAALAAIRAEVETDVDFANFGHRVKIAAGLGQMLENIPEPVVEVEAEVVAEATTE